MLPVAKSTGLAIHHSYTTLNIMTTILPTLAAQIELAIKAIPAAHREPPIHDTVVADPDSAFQRCQDWAFTQGFAFVIETRTDIRVRFECLHHKKETRNSRHLEEVDRVRAETYTRGTGCRFALYVSRQKRRGDQWILCWTKHTSHNHPLAPDPFQLIPHRRRRPGYLQALELAATHRGIIGYADSADILERQGLEIDQKTYYNLQRKSQSGQISDQEEMRLILQDLLNLTTYIWKSIISQKSLHFVALIHPDTSTWGPILLSAMKGIILSRRRGLQSILLLGRLFK
jgi:hypothetical protein